MEWCHVSLVLLTGAFWKGFRNDGRVLEDGLLAPVPELPAVSCSALSCPVPSRSVMPDPGPGPGPGPSIPTSQCPADFHGSLAGWLLAAMQAGWQPSWLTSWLTGWLTGWLAG